MGDPMFEFLTSGLCGFVMGCAIVSPSNINNYPSDWWRPVPREDLQSWEIPPQAADPAKNEVIISKRTELGVFSNLAEAHFQLDGENYASIEALWQSLKYPESPADERVNPGIRWQYTREQVKQLVGFEAKKAGDLANENMKKLGIQWQTYKGQKFDPKGKDMQFHYDLIYKAIEAKILQNTVIKDLLIKTGDLKFLPDHNQGSNITPAYNYCGITMKIRSGL